MRFHPRPPTEIVANPPPLLPIRLFFGKTKVMAKALGLSKEDEYRDNLSDLSKHLSGNVGLLFTSRDPESIKEFFDNFVRTDFARAGLRATYDFVVPAGTVYSRGGEVPVEDDVPLPHSLETTVRSLGMPTRLVLGKVTLDQEYVVCKAGQVLNSNQTRLLKTFGSAMAEFAIKPTAYAFSTPFSFQDNWLTDYIVTGLPRLSR